MHCLKDKLKKANDYMKGASAMLSKRGDLDCEHIAFLDA